MRLTVRAVATGLALGFAVYFAARAVWWVETPAQPLLVIAAIVGYLAVVVIAVLADAGREVRMPMWVGVLALVAAFAIPASVSIAFEPGMRAAPFATWYIGALGLLAVVGLTGAAYDGAGSMPRATAETRPGRTTRSAVRGRGSCIGAWVS